MALDEKEMELVMKSFQQVAPIADHAAEMFYGRLFEIAPETKELFRETDMKEQSRKLMQTLGTVIGALGRLDKIIPDIEALGKRHVAYGVAQEQYAVVGEALLWTLEQCLGDDFTSDVENAWSNVYQALTNIATRAYERVK